MGFARHLFFGCRVFFFRVSSALPFTLQPERGSLFVRPGLIWSWVEALKSHSARSSACFRRRMVRDAWNMQERPKGPNMATGGQGMEDGVAKQISSGAAFRVPSALRPVAFKTKAQVVAELLF